ncbi:uncharacterized protein L969DRAFT_19174 [Mixia osmundae IAM 14324]|uniref:Transcription factor 25 n=1 Tax=Mixia osmundae (strain CBS 9802 / IAM 14324 / JCM 22182 / KY 12970) TaxID=764103 RepID=G7DVH9_MIXOS|nr:uncharacterized protein L969DRAFT_19174 [Mixia osmundae IAM 14324]KEI37698.1 hypothetical protein L969DRAFT_19174 [Mixia osmundae IAM 14324]GAA94589.1 hypothetical protein E5Q_01241 [Mixia osmundae IAM 14324]
MPKSKQKAKRRAAATTQDHDAPSDIIESAQEASLDDIRRANDESNDDDDDDDGAVAVASSSFAALAPAEDEPEDDNEDVAPAAAKPKKKKASKKKAKPAPESDDLDALLSAYRAETRGTDAASAASQSNASSDLSELNELLSVDSKRTDPEVELRKMFGSRVVSADSSVSKSRGSSRSRTLLVKPKQTWPPFAGAKGGLDMRELSDQDGIESRGRAERWFSYEHSPAYVEVQQRFLEAVMSLDGNNLIPVLRVHPYHTDTLLQLSEMALQQGNPNEALDFLDRAIFAYEKAAIPAFSLSSGNGRLDFLRIENRGFFRALLLKTANLVQRGTYSAAHEIAKALYSLDPYDDPMGVLLWLDFTAVKAQQYTFIEKLLASAREQRSTSAPDMLDLDGYPGLAFAAALSRFLAGAQGSEERLEEAILDFPMVVCYLTDKLGLRTPQIFSDHDRSARAVPSVRPDHCVHLLAQMYAHRSAVLYKPPEVQAWLQRGIAACESKLSAYAKPQKGTYPNAECPEGVLRNVIMSDVPSLKPMLSSGIVAWGAGYSYDNMPPKDAISSYDDRYFARLYKTQAQIDAMPVPGAASSQSTIEALMRRLGLFGGGGGDQSDDDGSDLD